MWVDICTGDTFWREKFVSFWITIGLKWFWHPIGKFSQMEVLNHYMRFV